VPVGIVPRETWDQVQDLLKHNNQTRRNGVNAREPSLLVGIIVDEAGNRFTPSHAVKQGKRYRYYVSQSIIQRRPGPHGTPSRIPAHEIEDLVTRRLRAFIASPKALTDALALATDSTVTTQALLDAAKRRASIWTELSPSEMREFLRAIITSVVIGQHCVEIVVTNSGLRAALLGEELEARSSSPTRVGADSQEDVTRLVIEAQLKRCGGEVRMIVPGQEAIENPARRNLPLIKAIARAFNWREKLISGEVKTIRSIAQEAGLEECYVTRLMPCAFLAPDLIETILEGRQPVDLTLDKMLDRLPMSWAEQRKKLGFVKNPA
jgi:site-specific DNA recombinase